MAQSVTSALVVLVVDDEAPMRRMERRILEAAGCQVVEAGDGDAAIALLDQLPALDLIVTDVDMPGVHGDEMVRLIRAKRPDLKVLFVTGHSARLFGAGSSLGGQAFLEKPFTGSGLLDAMSLLLDGAASRLLRR